MKQFILGGLALFASMTWAVSQTTDADKILGTYNTQGNTSQVAITKQAGKYIGTLVATTMKSKLDENNPDPQKRKNPLVGTLILKDFVYDGDLTWKGGTAYDPKSGKTYKGKITLNADGSLNMRGYVGIPAFGRTAVWTRVK